MIEKINEIQSSANVSGVKNRKWGLQGQDEVQVAADGLAVSPFAREMATISTEMSKIPDVREDLVADIKRRIEQGTYKVDIDGLAARLVWAGINRAED